MSRQGEAPLLLQLHRVRKRAVVYRDGFHGVDPSEGRVVLRTAQVDETAGTAESIDVPRIASTL